ncbi:hypothetical protein CONPUDRAFT_144006 [Coniophora puteana RWD-64-598 SS2]|uniref:Heterokaryon incompatibility domain-containing protein n=1 Tax=Coniophora puteana (strain RWD-64-598) TaxID=741705 RepID=A0A5M3MPG7_CONPW|nr:uncharacterized protein CONPUDRAFT_144006 [Coniophora puteana RWD-64-598 SS2]EIW81082.1 hypothetical protein CONPUDRAFT_144006 [Coniophora puteana RWD-64-598 SS2]
MGDAVQGLPNLSSKPSCVDNQLRRNTHGPGQRYISPTSGLCRKLRIQAVNPQKGQEVPITDGSEKSGKLAVWLVKNFPPSPGKILEWILKWFWFTFALLWSLGHDQASYTGRYKPYRHRFWGQMWSARSSREYALRSMALKGHRMPIKPREKCDLHSITHALHPRQLVVYDRARSLWYKTDDAAEIVRHPYIAISYRQSDVFTRGRDEEGRRREKEQREEFSRTIQKATMAQRLDAYWLDLECIGSTLEEKNIDLYRMADIYRGAQLTLITMPQSAGDNQENWKARWESWGGRVWTLPEALLSDKLAYMIGNGPIREVTLHQLANWAYNRYDEETAIINAYNGKDPLERLERLSLLKSAIWRRASTSVPDAPTPSSELTQVAVTAAQCYTVPSFLQQNGEITPGLPSEAYPAERVYALMGFFEHRILPNPIETELQALARLSMANDSDRIAERMVSLLPHSIPPTACWYSDEDAYGANLWDIEPQVQVAGLTKNGALVLDGCVAAAIRWKNFPDIAFERNPSVRRAVSGALPYLFWGINILGIFLINLSRAEGIFIIIVAIVLLFAAPFLIGYSESGRILYAQPWLIGVKGVLTTEQVSERLFGGAITSFPRTFYTPSGSLWSIPGELEHRMGDGEQATLALLADNEGEWRGHMYTLVDTLSCTIYYFRAERPPTVAVFTGTEGGMGRFVLCSETCAINELHKETVLRMPSHIHKAMLPCDWIAIGGLETEP